MLPVVHLVMRRNVIAIDWRREPRMSADNPYESPRAAATPPQRQIDGVVRVFRILGLFGILYATPVVIGSIVGIIYVMINSEGTLVWVLVMLPLHIAVIFVSREYLRVARHLREQPALIMRARLFCWLIMLGFPIFTVGYMAFPVMIILGAACRYQLRLRDGESEQE